MFVGASHRGSQQWGFIDFRHPTGLEILIFSCFFYFLTFNYWYLLFTYLSFLLLSNVLTLLAPSCCSKSEYVRCLHFTCEDSLYVATNRGYLYHAKLVRNEVPIVCMDVLSLKSYEIWWCWELGCCGRWESIHDDCQSRCLLLKWPSHLAGQLEWRDSS